MRLLLAGPFVAAILAGVITSAQQPRPGVTLGELTWQEAEAILTPSAVVVIPLGAAALEHGPHMRLDNDERLARHLAQRVKAAADVVVAPPLAYHFYPAFLEYPGSTSLSQNTARDITVEIVRTLAKYGPRRFYVLNTGVTPMFPLKDAAEVLADDGILLGYTDVRYRLNGARVMREQARTTTSPHADEVQTSMMLFVDPTAVEMRKAVREYGSGSGSLTRQKDTPGTTSLSGVVGDPTIATRQKGEVFVQSLLSGALEDIEAIRSAALPVSRTRVAAPPPPPAPVRPPLRQGEPQLPNGCLPSDERSIRLVGDRFSYLWRQMDAVEIGKLFTDTGDMRHPDGTIERGRDTIRQNRTELFSKREYRGSNHPVTLSDMRCLPGGTAIADGRWEIRLEDEAATGAPARNLGPGKRHSGYCTLVMVKAGDAWMIQAWRYTVNPADGTQPPTTLKQPGFIGRGGGN